VAVGDRCMSHGASARACVVESGACAILRRTGERLKSEERLRLRPEAARAAHRLSLALRVLCTSRSAAARSAVRLSINPSTIYSTLSLSAALTSCVSGRPSAAYAFSQRGQHHYRLDKFSLLFRLSTRFFVVKLLEIFHRCW
jgi:hypothetical protein